MRFIPRWLKTGSSDARLNRLVSTPPIRSRAAEEGSFEIPLWGIPLILVVLWVCLFSGLGAIGLVGPDEPRYAAIARTMAETHDWITPRLWGTPWFEKPVLYYWAAGIAMRIFGVSEFAARLPSALAGLLAVIAAAWAALRSYGLGVAWYTLLMLPASVAMIGFSRSAGPDMLFAGFLTASMAVAIEMLQTEKPGAILRIAFGFFLGVAVLAKGPAAVILAGGATLVWAAFAKKWTAPFRFLHPLVIAAFCVTALPWYVLCALRNPDFLRVFIWQHNFERYTTPIFEHRQPIWYYGYIVLLAVLPWIVFLLGALFRAGVKLKNRATPNSVDAFYACWAAFPILFFSLSQSKLPGYILPAIPPLFVLLGRWVSVARGRNFERAFWGLVCTGVAVILLAIALGTFGTSNRYYDLGYSAAVAALVILLFGSAVLILALKNRAMMALGLASVLVLATVETANLVVLPKLDSAISDRQLTVRLHQDGVAAERLSVYRVSRSLNYGLDYYMNRELPEWGPDKSQPEWILGLIPPDIQGASQYRIADANPRGEYIPLTILYHRK